MTTPASPYIIDDREKGKFRVNRQTMVDPAILELERARIFDRCWLYVGHESELADLHDYKARSVGGRPLIFTRSEDGQIRVFINSCTHRGAILCRDKAGNSRFLKCFYHAWTFNTKGELIALPDEDAYGACFDRSEVGLVAPPRVEQYRGFWFVNYDHDAIDLETYLADAKDFIDLFADQGLDDGMEILGGTHEYSMRANWKLLVENSYDGYHALPTHQRYFEMLKASGADMGARGSTLSVSGARELGYGHGTVFGVGSLGRDLPEGGARAADAERRAEYRRRYGDERAERMAGSRNVIIFPNLVLIDLVMGMTVRTFEPVTPDYLRVTAWQLAPKNEDATLRRARLDNFLTFWGPGGLATPDDVEALECCQQGFLGAKELGWSDVSRGMTKERPGSTDELQMRTFWRRYNEIMSGEPMTFEHRGM